MTDETRQCNTKQDKKRQILFRVGEAYTINTRSKFNKDADKAKCLNVQDDLPHYSSHEAQGTFSQGFN